jgi:hypothetical protein
MILVGNYNSWTSSSCGPKFSQGFGKDAVVRGDHWRCTAARTTPSDGVVLAATMSAGSPGPHAVRSFL